MDRRQGPPSELGGTRGRGRLLGRVTSAAAVLRAPRRHPLSPRPGSPFGVILECCPIPPCAVSGCLVGALEKREQSLVGLLGAAHLRVGQQELAALVVVERLVGLDLSARKTIGLWVGIRVENALLGTPWPEAAAAELVRIPLDHYPSADIWRAAGMPRGRTP